MSKRVEGWSRYDKGENSNECNYCARGLAEKLTRELLLWKIEPTRIEGECRVAISVYKSRIKAILISASSVDLLEVEEMFL